MDYGSCLTAKEKINSDMLHSFFQFTTRGGCSLILVISLFACGSNSKDKVDKQKTDKELSKINTLLHDTAFAALMAGGLEANYYTSQGRAAPAFFEGPDSLVKKPLKDEKIATKLSGFYAVETGIGALVAEKGNTPVFWLDKIVNKSIDSSDALLLNRFANASWKAGQPFRALTRITRDNFISFNFLSKEEIQKDADQVRAAAENLLDSLKGSSNKPVTEQWNIIGQLLRDKSYALDMAKHMETAYYAGQNKPAPPFLSPEEEGSLVAKSVKEEKIAINIAGFYALECGLSYMVARDQQSPSTILENIIADSLPQPDKELLERFANATWKAGQPFRNLDRITRDIFTPFDLLSAQEKEKDWVQIKAAAKKLLAALQ